MATTQKRNSINSASKFSDTIFKVAHRFSVFTAFDDFFTMAIAAFTQNIQQKVSYYEEEYLAVMEKYKSLELRHEFPKAFASLIIEMEERVLSEQGNDVLGEFFEWSFFSYPQICFKRKLPSLQSLVVVLYNFWHGE